MHRGAEAYPLDVAVLGSLVVAHHPQDSFFFGTISASIDRPGGGFMRFAWAPFDAAAAAAAMLPPACRRSLMMEARYCCSDQQYTANHQQKAGSASPFPGRSCFPIIFSLLVGTWEQIFIITITSNKKPRCICTELPAGMLVFSFSMMMESYPLDQNSGQHFCILVGLFELVNEAPAEKNGNSADGKAYSQKNILYVFFVCWQHWVLARSGGSSAMEWCFLFCWWFLKPLRHWILSEFFSTLSFKKFGYDKVKLKQYYPLMAAYLGVEKPTAIVSTWRLPAFDTFTRKPNIVLVICKLQCLQNNMVGNGLNTTPCNQIIAMKAFILKVFHALLWNNTGVFGQPSPVFLMETRTASRNPDIVDQHTIINNLKRIR